MKIEIDTNMMIDKIASKVIKQLTPLIGNAKNTKPDVLMSVADVAEYLKVTKSWVYEKVHTRQIPFRKAGKFPRFKKNHIDQWMTNPYHPDLNPYNLNHNGRG